MTVKLKSLQKNKLPKKISKLLYQLHNDFELHNDNERDFLNKRLRSFLNYLISYMILGYICVSSKTISSAFNTKPELPFSTWHPLDWTNDKLSYWFAWVHISVATYAACGLAGAGQMFSCYLMVFVGVLIEVLGQRLSCLLSSVDATKTIKNADELIKCIQMHLKILDAINEYKICFSYILICDVCSTAIGLCCTVYQLGMKDNQDLSDYLFLITFLAVLNCQLFLPCYFGNEMSIFGDDLLKQTYFSNWLDMTHKSRKSLICLMERLKFKNVIVVGKIFPISLETFTAACVNAYRLFTLLQSIG